MKLNRDSLKNTLFWKQAGFEIPEYDPEQMSRKTCEEPAWIHFGGGNIFRGFIAALQQKLLNEGKAQKGIIVVSPHDYEIVDQIYRPSGNLTLLVHMLPDGSLEKKVIGSIAESLVGDAAIESYWQRLKEIFCKPSLQMASFTVTEKGYALTGISGEFIPDVKYDIENGPEKPKNLISKITALMYLRYGAGKLPMALVSMDNCSHNGDVLKNSIVTLAEKWVENGFADRGYLDYLNDGKKVSFPCTMIDKITPRPSETVHKALLDLGLEDIQIICTPKKTYISQFVNAERPQYLVVEDDFPNGRPPLEAAGVYFTDKDTVDRVERMKVTTCLNPLHTALAVFGCLLGYKLIADEMKDPALKKLVERIGYDEGMPVVVNPGIIDPGAFIAEVLNERFPNPFIPDTPQRIACDTSQKMPVRFGETIKTYFRHPALEAGNLTFIPLIIAGWCRYLTGVDDSGNKMELSPDPMLNELTEYVKGVELGKAGPAGDCLKPLLSNGRIFGMDLYEAGLGEKIEGYFAEMTAGKNAVRNVLEKLVGD